MSFKGLKDASLHWQSRDPPGHFCFDLKAMGIRWCLSSYRIVRRVNENTCQKAYYLQATFVPEAPPLQTRQELGALGLDLNEDHLALAETDRFGNLPLESKLLYRHSGRYSRNKKQKTRKSKLPRVMDWQAYIPL